MTQDSSFSIETRWQRPPEAGEGDIAEISIRLGERVLTQLLDMTADETRNFVRASAVSLALWCADNWWRLRWEPIPDYRSITADWRLRHELTSASGGTAWPPLMIYGVGERVVVAPISIGSEMDGPVQYRPMIVSIVPARDYEEGLDAFFQRVLATCTQARDGAALKALVDKLNEERLDPEVTAWRRLEASLSYDPDEAPEGLIENLSGQEARIGAAAVEEAAIGCPGAHAAEILQQAIAASEASEVKVDLAVAADAAQPDDHVDLARPIWMVAEDAAGRLRQIVGRPNGPLLNKAFSEILQARWDSVIGAPATASELPYGARLKVEGTVQRAALQTRTSHDRRFELARILGDAVWSRDVSFGVIGRGKTDRQKFQRAFAQSLLCPFVDLRNDVDLRGPTDRQIEAAARRYHVHRSVVRTLLVNKGFLPRETLGEKLEAA